MRNLLISPPEYSYEPRYFGEYPIGLMKLSTHLKKAGEEVELFDFLPFKGFGGWDGKSINYSGEFNLQSDGCVCDQQTYKAYKGQSFGLSPSIFSRTTGEYISRLGFLRDRYYQGIEMGFFREYLLQHKPDRIWVSSGMTYGYRGTVEVIDICKEIYPDVEVRLGGIYPTLCYEHAKQHTKADIVMAGECADFADEELDYEFLPNPPQYIIVQLCKGCPNKCKFCAVSYMDGVRVRYVDIDENIAHIKKISEKYNLHKIRLWGSNLLLPKRGKLFEEWLDKIIALDKNFTITCPEGFAPELLTVDICKKIKKAGFYNIVIPLEEANEKSLVEHLGKAYNVEDWKRAVNYAKEAGIPTSSIQVPIIVGTPNQTVEDIIKFLEIIDSMGVKPGMAKYVPVPKSQWYEESEYFKSLDLEYGNGILYPAITDINVYKPMSQVFGVLMESLVQNYSDRIKQYFKETNNGGKMLDTGLIRKLALAVVDIADQNTKILEIQMAIQKQNQELIEQNKKLIAIKEREMENVSK